MIEYPVKITEKALNVYVDGVYLKRSWGGEIQNVSVLGAIDIRQVGVPVKVKFHCTSLL